MHAGALLAWLDDLVIYPVIIEIAYTYWTAFVVIQIAVADNIAG